MDGKKTLVGIVALVTLAAVCQAEGPEKHGKDFLSDICERETLTNGLFGLNNELSDKGIEVGLGMTNVYQANVKGGLSTHNRKGRYTGSYDLELSADLRKLLGFETGTVLVHLEGGWPDEEGIDGLSVGSAFGVNADAVGNNAIIVKQLYYEGPIFNDNLTLMIGKIDFTGVFDCSAYADCECTQFLNAAFVDNPTIPFPQYSLGAVLRWNLTDSWYLTGGIADAQADGRETGFRTAFGDEDYFFYVLETGITRQLNSANGPMPGTYRIGMWNDPQPKANSDATKNYRDDAGFYLSCDQMLAKENSDPQDNQGLGAFFRFGYAPSKKNDITNFWSFGFQYQGPFEGRDEDVFGVGFAQGFFADSADSTYTEDYESVVEVYYNVQVTPWFNLSPIFQYVANPGGMGSASDAVVLGVRTQICF
ncbi:Porin B [subsurface metagenome]